MNKTILRKVHLVNWYGFSNRTIPLSEHLTLISGENECGKSTLFAFFVFMFYGTKIKKKPGELSFKDRYMPWDGSAMAGRIIFETNGKEYSLERLHLPLPVARSFFKTLSLRSKTVTELFLLFLFA